MDPSMSHMSNPNDQYALDTFKQIVKLRDKDVNSYMQVNIKLRQENQKLK